MDVDYKRQKGTSRFFPHYSKPHFLTYTCFSKGTIYNIYVLYATEHLFQIIYPQNLKLLQTIVLLNVNNYKQLFLDLESVFAYAYSGEVVE